MEKSCSSSGEDFSIHVDENKCRHRLHFVDTGFALAGRRKLLWVLPGRMDRHGRTHGGVQRETPGTSTSLVEHGPTSTLRWCPDLISLCPEYIWKSESSRAVGFCLLVQAERSQDSGMSRHTDCQHLGRSAGAWAVSCRVTQPSEEFVLLKMCQSLDFWVCFCAFIKCSRTSCPREGALGSLYTLLVFFPARINIWQTWRQNSAVVSPAKYAVNILDESNNKNVNALGKAPHCIVWSFSFNLVLHNQCMGPEQCKLFLNTQTANRECLLKKKERKKTQILK